MYRAAQNLEKNFRRHAGPVASVPEIKAIAMTDNKSKVGFIYRLWLGG